MPSPGFSSIRSIEFSILGSDDVVRTSYGFTETKATFKEGIPEPKGVYDAHYGTTEMSWNCQTCLNNKIMCPGHAGRIKLNYPVQNPMFDKEIIKWLKIVCHNCGEFIVKKDPPTVSNANRLTEFVKMVRAGSEKSKNCENCGVAHPWVSRDPIKQSIIWVEWYAKGNKTKSENKRVLYNHEIYQILSRVSPANCLLMGKQLEAHPRKLIISQLRVSPTAIRPEIRKIGGNRSSMADATASLRTIVDVNNQIAGTIPEKIDMDTHAKYVIMNNLVKSMIYGTSSNTATLSIVTNTNKVPSSIASRLPTKHGRIRGNLMGKRTTNMMRSVITGDKALRLDQVGVPLKIARNLYIPEVVRPWNRDRLMTYYMNGPKKYPGCNKIWKRETGREHYVEKLIGEYVPQDGDIIYRNIIDDDSIGFNREPSLLFCSITVLNAKIINGLTLRINSSICNLFNADFDGDEMNGLLLKDVESIAETKLVSGVTNWFMSYQNSKPRIGLYQDSVIGAFEMTRDHVDGIDKFHAMHMTNRTNVANLSFDKKSYHARELISMFLPDINFTSVAKFYVQEFLPYIKYSDTEINVRIERGQLVSGVLDKGTVGQDSLGGLFHTIYLEKGSHEAIDTIYNLQQLINNFIFYQGITIGFKDIYLSQEARAKLKTETQKIIRASEEVTEQLVQGKLVPPVEMTLEEYYEQLQMSALDHGDEFIKPILEEIDTEENWLYKFIFSGSKGDRTHLMAIYSSIGQIAIKGNRIKQIMDNRTTMDFPRFSTDPISRGYNPSNFSEGISPETYKMSAMEARYELIEIALSTALAGAMNRNAIKNLESILISNTRASIKKDKLVQLLYGDSGFDPRKVEKVVFPTVKCSDQEFESRYRATSRMFSREFHNAKVDKVLEQEFAQLSEDREQFRKIFLQIESSQRRGFLFQDQIRMPVNPVRIINDIITLKRASKTPTGTVNPLELIRKTREYVDSVGYSYMNSSQRARGVEIPAYIESVVTLLKILLRSYLSSKYLVEQGIDDDMLDMIFTRIDNKISECFIEFGTNVGVIAAQSISEPITQFLLDAKHRSGLKKAKTNKIDRIDEILKSKDTASLSHPIMTLIPLLEYRDDRQRVMEIANHIEMLNFKRFVVDTKIFIEEFGRPIHPDFVSEERNIKRYLALTFGDAVPKDLINWCIRFELDKEEMVLKSMKIKTIFLKLTEKFPNLYIVYFDTNDRIVMRVYMRNIAFKRGTDVNENSVRAQLNEINECIIRGVEGIVQTNVVSLAYSERNADGSIEAKKMFAIETDGTNLSSVLENRYLDTYECNTISIEEIARIYGIAAARNKIVDEILSVIENAANYEHASIYADEMTYNGRVTSIQRSGLGKRELDNVMLRASFGSPVQVFQQAAINCQRDNLYGMSAPMIVGTVPRFGTTYNDVCIDTDYIKEIEKSKQEILEEI